VCLSLPVPCTRPESQGCYDPPDLLYVSGESHLQINSYLSTSSSTPCLKAQAAYLLWATNPSPHPLQRHRSLAAFFLGLHPTLNFIYKRLPPIVTQLTLLSKNFPGLGSFIKSFTAAPAHTRTQTHTNTQNPHNQSSSVSPRPTSRLHVIEQHQAPIWRNLTGLQSASLSAKVSQHSVTKPVSTLGLQTLTALSI